MRQRMPAKRHILIACVVLASGLCAQPLTFWSNSAVFHYRSIYKEHLTGYRSDLILNGQASGFDLELENRFLHTDRVHDALQARTNERVQLSVGRDWKPVYLKAFYRFDLYDNAYGNVVLPVTPFPYYKDRSTQAGMSTALTLSILRAEVNSRIRSFSFQPVIGMISDEIDGRNLKTDAHLDLQVLKPVSVFVNLYDKFALDDDFAGQDISAVGTGVKLDASPSPLQHLEMQTGIDWIESDAISEDRLIPVTSRARYSRTLTPQLTGFASYELRNFYDREAGEMLFNSQFLRASGKYSLLYDATHASFIELGGKLSPQDHVTRKSTALYGRSELKVLPRFYLGAGVNHMLDRYTHYEALARYFITPFSEVFLDYVYSDDLEYNEHTTYSSAGLRLVF